MNSQQQNNNYILGIFCYFHDSSACLLRDGKLIAMAEEERFNRKKHTFEFPTNAIRYCLNKGGINQNQISNVAFGWLPMRFFIKQLTMSVRNFPKSLNLLRKGSSYILQKDKLINLFSIGKRLHQTFGMLSPKISYIDHHTAHAYSTYYVSPFDDAAILIVDGFGEESATSFYYGKGDQINALGSISLPNSMGVYYGAITEYLGFRPHSDEYKVMGMCAYGEDRYTNFFKKILSIDGFLSYKVDNSYFDFYTHGVNKWASPKLEKELGPRRNYGDKYEQLHFDIAHSAQVHFEDVIVKLATDLRLKTGSKNLCIAGGCAQNVLMNRALLDRCGFENIYVPPVASDAGVSLGAALAVHHQQYDGKRQFVLESASLGPDFSDDYCKKVIRERNLTIQKDGNISDLIVKLLTAGKIIGYFDGQMEIGPRALGNRSILADPRRHDIKDILNSRIKKREFFRPFAPMVPIEDSQTYFDLQVESPFMTLVGRVITPDNLPAITHNDGTARIQTVKQETLPNIHRLLKKFGEITGIPVLLSTSLNENEPIVCTPEEAVDCFVRTKMDVLVFNNKLLITK